MRNTKVKIWSAVAVATLSAVVVGGAAIATTVSGSTVAPSIRHIAQGETVSWPSDVPAIPDGPPQAVTVGTAIGPVTIPDPRYELDGPRMRFLARSGGQWFFEGTSRTRPGFDCLMIVVSTSEGQTTCGDHDTPLTTPNVMWAERPNGVAIVGVQLPDGYTEAAVDGDPIKVVNSVFGFEGSTANNVIVTASGRGVPNIRHEVGTHDAAESN